MSAPEVKLINIQAPDPIITTSQDFVARARTGLDIEDNRVARFGENWFRTQFLIPGTGRTIDVETDTPEFFSNGSLNSYAARIVNTLDPKKGAGTPSTSSPERSNFIVQAGINQTQEMLTSNSHIFGGGYNKIITLLPDGSYIITIAIDQYKPGQKKSIESSAAALTTHVSIDSGNVHGVSVKPLWQTIGKVEGAGVFIGSNQQDALHQAIEGLQTYGYDLVQIERWQSEGEIPQRGQVLSTGISALGNPEPEFGTDPKESFLFGAHQPGGLLTILTGNSFDQLNGDKKGAKVDIEKPSSPNKSNTAIH